MLPTTTDKGSQIFCLAFSVGSFVGDFYLSPCFFRRGIMFADKLNPYLVKGLAPLSC
jgi:hypothetical protein